MEPKADGWDDALVRAQQTDGGWSAPRSVIGRPVLPAIGAGAIVLLAMFGATLALGANLIAAIQTAALPALAVGATTYVVIVRGRTIRWRASGDPEPPT